MFPVSPQLWSCLGSWETFRMWSLAEGNGSILSLRELCSCSLLPVSGYNGTSLPAAAMPSCVTYLAPGTVIQKVAFSLKLLLPGTWAQQLEKWTIKFALKKKLKVFSDPSVSIEKTVFYFGMYTFNWLR